LFTEPDIIGDDWFEKVNPNSLV
jgi:glutaminyl-tRNA synthetase